MALAGVAGQGDGGSAAPLVRSPLDTDADVARAIREHYTKFEHRVPMRDGAKLFTTVYAPKDATRAWPMLLMRTPYSVRPYGADAYPPATEARLLRRFAPSFAFVREGYIFVHQDVRGRHMSEGTFVDVRPRAKSKGEIDEATDAYDTIEWLVKHVPNNNGKVGAWGISYPGFYAAQAAIDAHPALKAVSPQAPVTDWYMGDDFHHNGAFFLADSFDFEAGFGKARPKPTKTAKWEGATHDVADVYDFFLAMGPLSNANAKYLEGKVPFWDEMMAHPNRDAYWAARDPRPSYRDAKPAIMTVGGWYDAEDPWGPLWTYGSFEKQGARSENVLVMGPWKHGGWSRTDGDRLGDVTFGQKTSLRYREDVELPFFRRHLKGGQGAQRAPLPEATVFETGTNTWRSYDAWPPKEARVAILFLREGGLLSAAPPALPDEAQGRDVFPSDPAKPVPYRGKPSPELDHDWVTDDQRFAARRPDVLVYQTGDLTEDVTLTGPLEASIWFGTTLTDADVIVKLIDVHPEDAPDVEASSGSGNVKMGGYQQLVRGEVMRGRFREGFASPKPFMPGEPALVRFSLPDVAHTFRAGHRIMIQIQSTWFPLVDRNPQTFVPSIYAAKAEDFKAAQHTVMRTKTMPSSIRVSLTAGALPIVR